MTAGSFGEGLKQQWLFESKGATQGRLVFLGNNYNNGLNGNNNLNNNGRFVGIVQVCWDTLDYDGSIMKTYRNLYKELCSYKNLEFAFKKARKGKTQKGYVIEFEKNLDENLLKLRFELLLHAYQPAPLKTFILRDPKTRKINVSEFRDRVVHHAICNTIEPIFDKRFIYDSYANRKFKGVHAALKRFDYFKRKITANGRKLRNARNNNQVTGFALKADIKHYFETVDHEILINLISRKIKDKKVLWLIRKVINRYDTKNPGKGMPLGNLTSQFFANVYLNEFDQFIKHKLKLKYYLRYVDDFVIFHNSKKRLEKYKNEINSFLRDKLKLELHPQKCKIIPLHRGVNLLGFRVFYYFKLLRKSNLNKMLRRFEQFKRDYKQDLITADEILESMQGWIAYASTANTYKLRQKIMKHVDEVLMPI